MKSIIIILLCFVSVSCADQSNTNDILNLNDKLAGTWKADAFEGELHETWKLNSFGWMEQRSFYIEQNDTLYAATTQIQKIGERIILISVIDNSSPKIFQAESIHSDFIIFENDDYKNPFEVTYEFISNKYRRTIKGQENDSTVVYTFNFKKVTKSN